MKISKLNNRILFFSPTVQAGWERESHRTDFQFIKELGSGSFGTVYKARHKKNQKIYAIKEIKKKSLESQKLKEHARIEVKIMYSLNHPHIIKLFNHFEDEVSIYLVLEYAAQGHLYDALKALPEGKFNEKQAAEYIRQVVLGISQLHSQKIMHRDIKLENILIDDKGLMKVADFGWSHFQEEFEERTTFCGTLDYLAPEMLEKGHKHDYRVDIWSIGVLIYELCTGQSPFSWELIKNKTATQEKVAKNIKGVVYSMPQNLSPACKNLIKNILVASPDLRPSTRQILDSPWLVQNNGNKPNEGKWLQVLKDEVKSIFPQETMVLQGKQEFTKEEIYEYSRFDSIINLKPGNTKKGQHTVKQPHIHEHHSPSQEQEPSNGSSSNYKQIKKLTELQVRVTQLELLHQRDQAEIKRLKVLQYEHNAHKECQQKIQKLQSQVSAQNKELEKLHMRLAVSQSKVLDYQSKG